MDVIYRRCAGLDVHKQTVVACARVAGQGPLLQEVRTFATTTSGLLELVDWLESLHIEHVGMEATGVYWKPVWHILEGHFELVLANAAHVKNVPGRKTDVNDAVWLADLLAHGLIRASFVPPTPVQELRTLTRTRKQFVRERAAHVQRIEKVLEDANLKITSVISDILGHGGRAVLRAIIAGHSSPDFLAAQITTRVKASQAELREALRGRISPHHRFMLKLHLGHIEALDQAIAEIEQEVSQGLEPFRQAARLLSTIPGVSEVSANVLIAEIGIDMSRFASPAEPIVSAPGLALASATSSSRVFAFTFACTARYSGAVPMSDTGTKSFCTLNAGLAMTKGAIASSGPSVTRNVWPSAAACARARAATAPPAPGMFSTTNACPSFSERRRPTMRATVSGSPPGA